MNQKLSKLIIEIKDEQHKDLKFMALELDTSLKVIVNSIIAVDETYDVFPLQKLSEVAEN